MRRTKVKTVVSHGKRAYKVESTAPDGSRRRRFFQDKNLAQDFADQCNRESVEAFNVDEPLRLEALACHKRLQAVGWTLTKATEYAMRHAVVYNAAPPIKALVQKFLAEKEADMKEGSFRPRSFDDLRLRLGVFQERFSDRRLHEITKKDLQEWNAELRTDGNGPTTRAHYLKKASQLFNWATPDYCERNPVKQVRLPHKAHEEIEFFGVPECRRLLQACAAAGVQYYLVLGLFLGIRPNELLRLPARDVDIAGRIIRLKTPVTKMSQRRVIELRAGEPEFEAAIAWLTGVAFPAQMTEDSLRGKLDKLKTLSGVEWVFDGLRRSACTYHVARHNDLVRTSYLMGHTTVRTLQQHYLGLATRAEADAFYAIRPQNVVA
jgi:integrase